MLTDGRLQEGLSGVIAAIPMYISPASGRNATLFTGISSAAAV